MVRLVDYPFTHKFEFSFLQVRLFKKYINCPVKKKKIIQLFLVYFYQFPAFGEDDLHTIVQMGFGQNPTRESELLGKEK